MIWCVLSTGGGGGGGRSNTLQKAMSVCEVTDATTPFENGVPRENGLMDLRMGTTERMFNCKTCSGNRTECPGHFGHIELVKPVLHPGFMTVTLKILRSVCYHCSSLLINPDHLKYREAMKIRNPAHRLRAIANACSGIKQCNGGFDIEDEAQQPEDEKKEAAPIKPRQKTGCGNYLPKYRKDGVCDQHTTHPIRRSLTANSRHSLLLCFLLW